MDNLTHTLTGMLVAEAVCAARKRAHPAFRGAAYLTSMLANNLPDIDPLYTSITQPRPLGSLLHHRGHTHTLLIAVPLGLLVAWAVLRGRRRLHGAMSAPDRAWVLGLGALGGLLHIGMDFGNNYGVHPLWPVDDRWYYGDTIFIVEPLWLAIALPTLAFAVSARWFKISAWVLLACVFALALALPFVNRGTLIAIAAMALWSSAVSAWGSPRLRIAVACASYLAVALMFAATSARAANLVRTAVQADLPALTLDDVVRTPLPGNPLCWSVLVVGTEGDRYRVVAAMAAPFPAWLPAAQCPYDAAAQPTAAPLPWRGHGQQRPALHWQWQYSASLAELRQLVAEDCRFRALLGFARVPYLADHAPGALQRVAGDLRYDRSPGLDFSDLPLTAGEGACPRFVPPWQPPCRALSVPGAR